MNTQQQMPARNIKAGDVLLLEGGEKVVSSIEFGRALIGGPSLKTAGALELRLVDDDATYIIHPARIVSFSRPGVSVVVAARRSLLIGKFSDDD